MLISKFTIKKQVTIPKKVRNVLRLQKEDLVVFGIKKNKVILKKGNPLDRRFTKSLEKTLSEWNFENDDKAYCDL